MFEWKLHIKAISVAYKQYIYIQYMERYWTILFTADRRPQILYILCCEN